ncbi:MAG TPA: hypothetical protein VNM46_12775 [Xanthobacteraceae bacterium]|nr:hypothetical protein [Xanthobacteraceae bacterium]
MVLETVQQRKAETVAIEFQERLQIAARARDAKDGNGHCGSTFRIVTRDSSERPLEGSFAKTARVPVAGALLDTPDRLC